MRAIVYHKYGLSDVLELQEVAKPLPREHDILIHVHAAAVTPADIAFRKGEPFLGRLFSGLIRPKKIPGVEFAGDIEAVGTAVTCFQKGDQVFGTAGTGFGAHAEYICVPEDGVVARKPTTLTYEEAVAVCDGALTALVFLRDKAHIQRGQKILINGASGAVGAAAVQLARYFGAEVTGVCSTTNVAMVRSLGSDTVIDYTKEDFTTNGQTYDIIFDAVGKSSFARCKGSLTPRGVYLATVPTLSILLQTVWTAKIGSKKAIFTTAGLKQRQENLNFLSELVEARKLQAVIDRRYPLEHMAEAHRYVEKGHKKGNVVIRVEQQSKPDNELHATERNRARLRDAFALGHAREIWSADVSAVKQ
jgi:NADPH:quinone reductase-like Zn-dependent oxidoreductase